MMRKLNRPTGHRDSLLKNLAKDVFSNKLKFWEFLCQWEILYYKILDI